MMQLTNYKKAHKVQKQVLAAVIFLHLLLIFLVTAHFGPKIVPKIKTKLVVHTYTMQTKPAKIKKAPVKDACAQEARAKDACAIEQKSVEPAPIPKEPALPQNEAQETRQETPQQEELLVQKIAEPILETPLVEKPLVEKQTVIQKPQVPIKQKVEQKEKTAASLAKKAPISSPKQKQPAKTVIKKEVPKQKQPTKPTIKKEALKPNKAQQEHLAKQRELEAKQNALIVDALSSLNKVEKNHVKNNPVKNSQGTTNINTSTTAVHQIHSLASESLVTIRQDESESQEFQSYEEKTYYDELVHRLKLHLKLPDNGDVRLKLTINRKGKVVSVACYEVKSKKNKEHLEKVLPTLIFPSFGQNFINEQTHTFLLHFSRDFS